MIKMVWSILLYCVSVYANAALIVQDLENSGDGLITYDNMTGLEWLDLTQTQGMSYNQVIEFSQVGGIFEGWRYASYQEALDLYSQFGFLDPENFGYLEDDQVRNAIESLTFYMGDLYPNHISYLHGFAGITGSLYGNSTNLRTTMHGFYSENSSWSYQNLGFDYFHPTMFSTYTGSLLVRETTVPEPSSILLLFTSLLLMNIKRFGGTLPIRFK